MDEIGSRIIHEKYKYEAETGRSIKVLCIGRKELALLKNEFIAKADFRPIDSSYLKALESVDSFYGMQIKETDESGIHFEYPVAGSICKTAPIQILGKKKP